MIFEALAILALIGGIAQVLKKDVQEKAGKEYDKFLIKSKKYEQKIKIANDEIEKELSKYHDAVDFHRLCELHFRSTMIANQAYEALEHGRKTQNEFYSTINVAKKEITKLKQVKSGHKNSNDYEQVKNTKAEIDSLYQLKDTMYLELENVKTKTKEFSNKVGELNMRTKNLKYQIRDSSPRGMQWYSDLENRTLMKKY